MAGAERGAVCKESTPIQASGQEENPTVVGVTVHPSLYHTQDGARRGIGQGPISPASYSSTGAPFISVKRGSSGAPGDIVPSPSWYTPSPCPVDDSDRKGFLDRKGGIAVCTDHECLNEAKCLISEIFKADCCPVVLVILVTNDDPSAQGPPFNAKATHEVYKKALETFGATVIPVNNQSKEFLFAIVETLKDRGALSCELLWFIFSGHGRESSFSIDQQFVEFDDTIRVVSGIRAPCFFFIFECCQLEGKSVKEAKLQSQHMVLYSAQPNGVSFHYDGVGLMAITLAEMLRKDYRKPLNDLQLELRQNLLEKIVAAKHIPPHEIDSFKRQHLPVQTTNMFENINLYEKIEEATRPRIAVTLRNGNREANIAVTHPRRIMHNSSGKFELVGYKLVNETEAKGMCLGTVASNFEVNPPQRTLALPLQADKMSGKLMVAAKYGDGRLVFSKPCEVSLPVYGKSTLGFEWGEGDGKGIARFTLDNGVRVSIDDHRFRTEWFQIGYFDSSNQWVELYRREGRGLSGTYPVTFNPSSVPLTHALQAAVKYENCCEVVYSEPQEIHQRASQSNVHHCISACWNVAPNPCKGFIALILTTLLAFSIALFCGIYYPQPLSNQLIAVEKAVPFQLKRFSILRWCSGVSVLEYTVEPTDFFPGFDVAVYLVDTLNLKPEHNTIPSTRYPYTDETIGYNSKDRYLLPNNYYQNPPYLLDTSVVSLRCKIDLPQTINNLSYANIHFFDSIGDATKYQHGASSKSPVHSISITDCVAAICTKNYTIAKNSFYFPVLSTKSSDSTTYQITVNFTFEVYSYVDPSTLPSAVNVANFSKKSSGEIPLHHSKVILLYAHPPNATAYERLAHLHFSCVPHYAVRVPVYLVLFLLGAVVVGLYCYYFNRKWRRNCLQPADAGERTSLINN